MQNPKDRLRKLLSLAKDDAATKGEVENAMRAAQRLMDEFHLTEDDIIEEVTYCRSEFSVGGRLTAWEIQLAFAVTKTIGSIKWYSKGRCVVKNDDGSVKRNARGGPLGEARIVFYGPVDDVALGIEMWESLRTTITTTAYRRYGQAFKGAGRSYALGFADALYKIAKGHQRTQECTAIVLRKSAKAEAWLKTNQGIQLVNCARSSYGATDQNAYGSGRSDGQAHGLHRPSHKLNPSPKFLT